jgi:serine kinase of HPr protein (carbohydrate metabolism regulator)
MALHCAAISKEGEAILIAGESGSGKSTVTDALLKKGYDLLADDLVIVRDNALGEILTAPGFPYQKLCRDVVTCRGYRLDDLLYINEEKDKFLVPYEGEFSLKEKPLKAMFLLAEVEENDRLLIEELKGIDKFHAYISNLFLRRLLKEQSYTANVGKTCLTIAAKISIYLIRRPKGKDTLNEIIEYITSCTEKLGKA